MISSQIAKMLNGHEVADSANRWNIKSSQFGCRTVSKKGGE